MKQIYLLIVALMTITGAYATAPTTTVMLQHQGNITFFEPDSVRAAIRESVDGDTIFLNEGIFPGFTIDKAITVRGCGTKTRISGSISIYTSGINLEGLNLYGEQSIWACEDIDGLTIKKCSFDSFVPSGKNIQVKNLVIDRCEICRYFYTGYRRYVDNGYYISYVMSATVSNTYIYKLDNYYTNSADIILLNCSINDYYYSENFRGTLMNCIINGKPKLSECSLINCLLRGSDNIYSSVHQNNNYYENTDYMSATPETLVEKGYLGNDGTPVGRYGGANPYTLDLGLPRVSSHTLNVDNAHKTLNVTIQLSE